MVFTNIKPETYTLQKNKKYNFITALLLIKLNLWEQLNPGKKPFVSIKIFEFDETRMKKRSNVINDNKKDKIEYDEKKKTRETMNKLKQSKVTYRKKIQSKLIKLNNSKLVKKEVETYEVIEEVVTMEIPEFDRELHYHIETSSEPPTDSCYTMTVMNDSIRCLTQVGHTHLKPIMDLIDNSQIVAPKDNISMKEFDQVNVEEALEILKDAKPIIFQLNEKTKKQIKDMIYYYESQIDELKADVSSLRTECMMMRLRFERDLKNMENEIKKKNERNLKPMTKEQMQSELLKPRGKEGKDKDRDDDDMSLLRFEITQKELDE